MSSPSLISTIPIGCDPFIKPQPVPGSARGRFLRSRPTVHSRSGQTRMEHDVLGTTHGHICVRQRRAVRG